MNSNLIVVRCDENSLHPMWLPKEGQERTWDLLVNYFGDSPDAYRSSGYKRIDSKGPKFVGLFELLSEHFDLIAGYKYVWFADDDILFSCEDANRFFAYCEKYNLGLAQPSLNPKSYASLPITITNPLFELRFTSMVEVMVPCFEINALRKVRHTFQYSQTGGGLDFVWPVLLGDDAKRIAVVDSVQVLHTRPLGGPNHSALRARRITILEEIEEVMRSFGVAGRHYFVRSGVLKGTERAFQSPRFLFLIVLAIGTVIGAGRMDKWPWVFKWKSILGFFRWQFRRPPFLD